MSMIFDLVKAGQEGDNKAIESLSQMDWFRACVSEQIDNVWKTYGGKMFADVYEGMDYDYILVLLSFMISKQVCTPAEGKDIQSRLGTVTEDTAAKAYVRKYIRNGAFKGEWNKVFYSYAYETHPSIGNNVAAFKRNMNVYTWFLANSVSRADVDKSDEEIIRSLDIHAITERYASKSEEDQVTLGSVKDAMEKDLQTLRAWFKDFRDISYADQDNNTQDTLDAYVDATIVSEVKEQLMKLNEKQRLCYLYHIVYKKSGPKVAELLGISETSVRRYSNQVKEIIKKGLEKIIE